VSVAELSSSERDAIFQCLKYILESDALDDDFHPRTGLDRWELADTVSRWPELEDDNCEHADYLAVNNCLNEICHALHFSDTEWHKWFTVPHNAIRETFQHWLRTVGR